MKCPVDTVELLMTERSGVEIDYCPQCRGVWLDRGELDKILERARTMFGGGEVPPERAGGAVPQDRFRGYEGQRERRDHDDDDYRRPKRRESWLEDLFD